MKKVDTISWPEKSRSERLLGCGQKKCCQLFRDSFCSRQKDMLVTLNLYGELQHHVTEQHSPKHRTKKMEWMQQFVGAISCYNELRWICHKIQADRRLFLSRSFRTGFMWMMEGSIWCFRNKMCQLLVTQDVSMLKCFKWCYVVSKWHVIQDL